MFLLDLIQSLLDCFEVFNAVGSWLYNSCNVLSLFDYRTKPIYVHLHSIVGIHFGGKHPTLVNVFNIIKDAIVDS